MPTAITIIRATAHDSKDIWLWRNDAETRAMSLSSDEISWEAHSRWFGQSLADRNRFIFIGIDAASEKIGMSRFDVDPKALTANVSINLNPLMRGRKLSSILLGKSIETFWSLKALPLTATVRKTNIASIKCFEKCGFGLALSDDTFNFYTLAP